MASKKLQAVWPHYIQYQCFISPHLFQLKCLLLMDNSDRPNVAIYSSCVFFSFLFFPFFQWLHWLHEWGPLWLYWNLCLSQVVFAHVLSTLAIKCVSYSTTHTTPALRITQHRTLIFLALNGSPLPTMLAMSLHVTIEYNNNKKVSDTISAGF